jgi:hypothetical protein
MNSFLGKTSNFGAFASAPAKYLGLSSTDPGTDGSGITEPSTGGYARQLTAASDWSAPSAASPAVSTNANAISFGTLSADWLSGATIAYCFLADASTSGHVLYKGTIATPKAFLNGDGCTFAVGALALSES